MEYSLKAIHTDAQLFPVMVTLLLLQDEETLKYLPCCNHGDSLVQTGSGLGCLLDSPIQVPSL